MRDFLPAVAIAPLLCCCQTSAGPRPEDVPSRMQLSPAPVDLLQVTLEATDAGYEFMHARRSVGVPTRAIHEDRAVLITAVDAAGEPVHSISVVDLRAVRTTGTRDGSGAVLDKGTLTLYFANPDAIRSLDLHVHDGPNAGFQTSVSIEELSLRGEKREAQDRKDTRPL